MKLPVMLKEWVDKFSVVEGDPIAAEIAMVSSIQKLVGIHNLCADNYNESFTFLSIFSIIFFAGTFIYVGTLSQIVYLVQVFPDKIEIFKALNCVSSTSVPLSKYIFMWTARTVWCGTTVLVVLDTHDTGNASVGSRLRAIFELSREGLSSIPEGSLAHARMMRTLLTARYARWLIVLNQAVTHILFLLMPFLFTVFSNERYLPTVPGEPFGLSPKYETPFFETTFIITAIATAFSAINQTGYIVLFVTLLSHELGHLYSITETLKDIYQILQTKHKNAVGNIEMQENVNQKLKFCMKHQQFMMKYHEKIRQLYTMIFGAHFLMMIIVIVTTLQTMNEWDVRNTILSAATGILPLFIYCFGGELLITAGAEMSVAVYSSGWELMEVKQARCILLMLSLSQRTLHLTAAKVFVMNRETFGNVAQVVYKIYAVFN